MNEEGDYFKSGTFSVLSPKKFIGTLYFIRKEFILTISNDVKIVYYSL